MPSYLNPRQNGKDHQKRKSASGWERRIAIGIALSAFSLVSVGGEIQAPAAIPVGSKAKLLVEENAYNPIPSPDGRAIAFVGTGWGRGRLMGTGRSTMVSDVKLMDATGTILNASLAPDQFLAGWSPDSKAVICYRDWHYSVVTISGAVLASGELPHQMTPPEPAVERIAFLQDDRRVIWLNREEDNFILRHGDEEIARMEHVVPLVFGSPVIAPSPDGRYLAIQEPRPKGRLWTYDRQLHRWADLGEARISPDPNWDYMKPAWNPWFADSKSLVFFVGPTLEVCSPDGNDRRGVLDADQSAGLAVPSPDGKSIAYVSFQGRDMTGRSDLKTWGNAGVWVVSTTGTGTPRQVTASDPDTTIGLRWLGNHTLVFDRIGENLLAMHARIWMVPVP